MVKRVVLLSFGTLFVLLCATPKAVYANGCDLFSEAAPACVINEGIFDIVAPHPTGTGVVNPFLRVQQKISEQGFNTGARPMLCDGVVCDDKTDPNFTRNLLTSDIPVVTIDGHTYRQFFLDINEPAGSGQNRLTLDQLEIYTSNTADLASHSSASGGSLGGVGSSTQVYRMDGPGGKDNWVNLDYSLIGGGSGSGDMVLYVLDDGKFDSQYTYLYSQFGCTSCGSNGNSKYPSQAGFEEWWVKGQAQTTNVVPEPATVFLVGSGVIAAVARRRRSKKGTRPQV